MFRESSFFTPPELLVEGGTKSVQRRPSLVSSSKNISNISPNNSDIELFSSERQPSEEAALSDVYSFGFIILNLICWKNSKLLYQEAFRERKRGFYFVLFIYFKFIFNLIYFYF